MIILSNVLQSIGFIISALKQGKIICFPTETVYSLSCDASLSNTISRIYKLKKRNSHAPLSILMKDIAQMRKYVILNEYALRLIEKFSPGPITYILPAILPNKLSAVVSAKNTIGVRIPDHSIARFILNKYKHPLVGTSVNISKKKPAIDLADIFENFPNIDIAVEDSGKCSGVASTVLDLSTEGQYKIIREGRITQAQIDLALS